jgi:ABC-type glycerol-3-phosphate transport system permease component
VPLVFVINSSFRSNQEMVRSIFGVPEALTVMIEGDTEQYIERTGRLPSTTLFRGYDLGWQVLGRYMKNSLFVSILSAVGTVMVASLSAYALARYRFIGSKVLFAVILSTMMVPAVLTLVPSFLLVRALGLLDTYWVLILPYVAGGQVFAIFLFRSFFAGLPEELFESARIDGAGHVSIYLSIVLPLSRPIIAVAAIMNILFTWNNFLWPFVTISQDKLHVVASGLYIMSVSTVASNMATMYASYVIASIPLLILFIYATKPFVQGVTSGALKA